MFLRIRIALARHEAKTLSKHAVDKTLTFNANVKNWTTPVGRYKRGKRVA